jgi:hypothetical protein
LDHTHLTNTHVFANSAPANDTVFFLVINGMTDQSLAPMTNAHFEFDNSTNWRLQLPSEILTTATKNKTEPLRICLFLSAVWMHQPIYAIP